MNTAMPQRASNGRFLPKSKKKSKKVQPQIVNHIAIVLDESGSMTGLRAKAVEMVKKNLVAISEQSKTKQQTGTVRLFTFEQDSVKVGIPVTKVEKLDPSVDFMYSPGGMTNLYDAIGSAITALSTISDPTDSRLVIVVTDGLENSSSRWSATRLSEEIKRLQGTDFWTFAFLVPPGSKAALVARLGVPEGNVQEWEQSVAGIEAAAASVVSGTQLYYATRASGQTSTKGFYNTDLSGLKKSTITRSLDDVSSRVSQWKVDREQEISGFCRNHNSGVYNRGSGFYQLTKDETIQPYKQLMIKEKSGTAIYTGPQARQLLGLPESGEIKVRPGNHANYDVFVQSTSSNRKLVRGTTVLYLH